MATPLLLVWLGLLAIIGLNGFAAGVVAVLHAWRSGLRRGSTIFLASAFAGFLPAGAFVGIGILRSGANTTTSAVAIAAVFGVMAAVGAAASVPGALIVARRLETPGSDYRAFE